MIRTDWGGTLLHKGDLDGAIAKFRSAHQKGPHFADPLEGWGEALLYAGKKDEAKAQFARAAQLDLTPIEKSELAGDLSHV
jgi:Flp pilus assembly protein TadD